MGKGWHVARRDVSELSPAYVRRLERFAARYGLGIEEVRANRELLARSRGHAREVGAAPERALRPISELSESYQRRLERFAARYGLGAEEVRGNRELRAAAAGHRVASPRTVEGVLEAALRSVERGKIVRVAVDIEQVTSPTAQRLFDRIAAKAVAEGGQAEILNNGRAITLSSSAFETPGTTTRSRTFATAAEAADYAQAIPADVWIRRDRTTGAWRVDVAKTTNPR